MSHFINEILSKTIGFKLTRAKIRRVDKTKDFPIYVEFIGIPAVGKSTLYQNVFKEVKRKWRDIHEFQRIFTEHTDGTTIDSLSYYELLSESKMQSVVSRDFSGLDQMKLVKYFHSVLVADSLIYLFNKDYNVMSEEGLIHNFGESLFALSKSNEDDFKSLMKHRAVVYCHASAEIVAKRILERKEKTGKLLPQHKLDSLDDLVKLQQKSLEQKHLTVDFLHNYAIPVLSIDTSKPMIENINQVKQFLNELTQRK